MSEQNALVIYNQFDKLEKAADALYKSGYFQDTKSHAQAIVKVLAGAELGLPPFASMTGIHIIQGKPALGANVIATLVKNDPRYDYHVTKATDEECTIQWSENGEVTGISNFTMDEAKRAGLNGKDNWKKFPSDMLFARAITRGARRFAPGIFGGSPVYTPEELGADTDEEGALIIEGQATEVQHSPPPTNGAARPYPPDVLHDKLTVAAEFYKGKGEQATDHQRKVLAAQLTTLFDGDDTKRYEFSKWATGAASTKEMSDGYVLALLNKWLEVDDFGRMPNEAAMQEAKAALPVALKAAGQAELEI